MALFELNHAFWKFPRAKQLFFGTPFKKTFFSWKCSFFFFNMTNWVLRSFFVPFKKIPKMLKKNRNLYFRDFSDFQKKKKFQIFPKLPISHLWWILSTFSLSKFFSKMHGNIIFQRLKNVCWTFFLQVLDWSWDFELNVFLLRAPRCSQSSESMGRRSLPIDTEV